MKVFCYSFTYLRFCILFLSWLLIAGSTMAQNVRFSELSGDAGNNDGTNDGMVELTNDGATPIDVSCYVISNGEWVVVLPPSTFINPGEPFLIACSEGQNVGANPNPVPGSGLTCATCDFPNMPITFDVCDPANAAYVDWAASGFTIDNQADDDGDQIVLFDPSGSIVQAVQWGGGATAPTDNTAVQTGTYTLGTPGTGGSGLSSAQLPLALQAGGSCANSISYVMPQMGVAYENLTNASNAGGKAINNTVLQGCNSSFIYLNGDWQKTDHPNPGQLNDALAYQFSFSESLVQCPDLVDTNITATLEVYNWQAVTPGIMNAKGGIGSFVSFDGGVTQTPWDTYNRDDASGITTMTYTFPAAIGIQTLSLVWDDDKSSEFASTPSGSTSGTAVVNNTTPSDCYTIQQEQVIVAPIMMASTTDVTCPTDFPAGTVNIGSLISGGYNVTYELFDNGVSQGANSTGIFNIPDHFTGPITVVVTDGTGCTNPITIDIDNSCRQAPVCPANLALDACTTAPGSLCPGDDINLSLDATTVTGLPNGGVIEWVRVANATDDPYLSGTVVATQTISVTGSTPSGTPVINEILVDAQTETGSTYGEGWEIAGTPGTDIGCHYFTDGDFVVQIPAGTVIPADGFYVIGSTNSGASWNSDIDLLLTSTSIIPNLTNGGEYLAFFDASSTFLQGVTWGTPSTTNAPATTGAPTTANTGAGCAALPSYATIQNAVQVNSASFVNAGTASGTNENSIELDMDMNGSWQLSAAPGSTLNTLGTSNTGASAAVTMLTPTCATYTVPADACNSTIHIRPRIVPVDDACGNPTLAALSYDVVCPTITVSDGVTVCAPAMGTAAITATNTGGGDVSVTLIRLSDASTYGPFIRMGDGDILATGLPAGEFQIQTASVMGACAPSTSGTATIQINPAPDITLSGMIEVCPGLIAEIPFTINAGTLPFQISYNIDAGTNQTVEVFSNQLNIPTTGLASGARMLNIVALSDDNNCTGTASGNVTINVLTPPDLASIPTQNNACPATTVNLTNISIVDNNSTTGSLSYHTTLSGAQTDNATDLVPDPNAVGAGTFYIRKETAQGCFDVASVEVTISTCICADPPSVVITETNVNVCGTSVATLNYTVTNGPASLMSNGTGTLSTNTLSDGTSTFTYTPAAGDIGNTVTITATIADPDGVAPCTNSTDVVTITVNPLPSAFNVTGGGAFCMGGAGVAVGLDDSETGVNYQLQLDGSNVGAAVPGTGNAISFGNQTQAGVYTVVATNAATNCTQNMTGNVTVIINPLPSAFNVTGGGTFCMGGAGVAVGLDDSETGVNYQLQLDGSNVGAAVPGTGNAISFGNQTQAGVYTVVATNAATNCTQNMTGNVTVIINPLPSAFNVTGGGTFCMGGAGVAVGLDDSETGVNYQLQLDGFNVGAVVPGTGNAISFGNQTQAGVYTVVATNAATNCTQNMSGSAMVVVNSVTPGTISGSQTVCITKDPEAFSALAPATGSNIEYQWESSTTNCDNGFSPILDATAATFDPMKGQFTVTTYFRRRAISTLNGVACEAVSNCIVLTVLNVDCGAFPWNGN